MREFDEKNITQAVIGRLAESYEERQLPRVSL